MMLPCTSFRNRLFLLPLRTQSIRFALAKYSSNAKQAVKENELSLTEDDLNEPKEPEFKLNANGVGSLAVVDLNAGSKLTASPSQCLGYSPSVEHEFIMDGTAFKAAGRKLCGGELILQQFRSKDSQGQVLLAPNKFGSMSVVKMDGSTIFHIKRGSFVASLGNISIESHYSMNSGFTLAHLKAVGRGSFLFSGHGNIQRITLLPEESYLIHPRYVLVWDSTLKITPKYAFTAIPANRFNDMQDTKETLIAYGKAFYQNSVLFLKRALFPEYEMYSVTGPGTFYYCTRQQPALIWKGTQFIPQDALDYAPKNTNSESLVSTVSSTAVKLSAYPVKWFKAARDYLKI